MIILDTNVLSALMRDEPDQRVVEWLDGQAAASTWITSITVFEIRFGLALLPDGRRRRALGQAFEGLLADDLGSRILSFDAAAAAQAATLAASRQRMGIVVDIRDTLIAVASPAVPPSPRAICAISRDLPCPWSALGARSPRRASDQASGPVDNRTSGSLPTGRPTRQRQKQKQGRRAPIH